MSMREFADHVIAISNEFANGITNLELQKVMYFVLGDYINTHGIDEKTDEIYDEPFEAWPYGPVIRSEYFRNRKYGRYNILRQVTPSETYKDFNDLIIKHTNRPITEMVKESHEHSTWLNNREAILMHDLVEYNLEDLENDFTTY